MTGLLVPFELSSDGSGAPRDPERFARGLAERVNERISAGASGMPTASVGFSRNDAIRTPSAAGSMTPDRLASASGTRSPATVTPAPEAMCCSTICAGSMR